MGPMMLNIWYYYNMYIKRGYWVRILIILWFDQFGR